MTDYGTIYNSGGFFSRKNREKWGRNGEESRNLSVKMAERGGFEPPEGCPSSVFKTDALNHSTISPLWRHPSRIDRIKYSKKGKNQGGSGKKGGTPEKNLKKAPRSARIKGTSNEWRYPQCRKENSAWSRNRKNSIWHSISAPAADGASEAPGSEDSTASAVPLW